MKFFFPDSQDLVDPSFDFINETRSKLRLRQRDDQYAHEVFANPPYDGMLVSMASVNGNGGEGGRYSLAQKHRLLRERVRLFFRLNNKPLETMGDCGAFAYVSEEVPPVTVEEVVEFYNECDFDMGVSVDHVIPGYQPNNAKGIPEWVKRQEITLELAQDFLQLNKKWKCRFLPIGVAQGWSPKSYAHSVTLLQKMGYRRIGLGGMVSLKTNDIVNCLEEINGVRNSETRFHLFGVTRCDQVKKFGQFGVSSFDSTSPLRQAFKHDRENYYTMGEAYSAIRVPQIEGNISLRKKIVAGEINQDNARKLEQECLRLLLRFDDGKESIEKVLKVLREYEVIHDDRKDRTADYRRTLEDKCWKLCPCEICKQLGIHVVLFRGAERNRRRGFHNIFVVYEKLKNELIEKKMAVKPKKTIKTKDSQ